MCVKCILNSWSSLHVTPLKQGLWASIKLYKGMSDFAVKFLFREQTFLAQLHLVLVEQEGKI